MPDALPVALCVPDAVREAVLERLPSCDGLGEPVREDVPELVAPTEGVPEPVWLGEGSPETVCVGVPVDDGLRDPESVREGVPVPDRVSVPLALLL